MALSENVKLFLKLEATETANTLGGLKERAELLTQALEKTKIGTEEYKKLNQQLINTSKQVKNLELGFEALDAEQVASEVGSVAGAVGDVGAGLLLLSGGNEELEEMVGKIETALGATMALKGGIEGLSSARKLWNDAMARGNQLTQIAIVLQETLNKASKANIFLAFAGAISAIAVAILKWGQNASATEIAQEKLNEASLQGAKVAGEEEAKIKVLASTLMDATASTDARKDALERLNEVIPDTIGFITEETIATGEAITVIEEYIRLVKQRAELTALESMLAEQIGERVRLQVQLQQAGNDAQGIAGQKIQEAIEGSKVFENQLIQQINALQKNISAVEDSGDAMEKNLTTSKEEIRSMRTRTKSLKENTESLEENTDAVIENANQRNEMIEQITQAEDEFLQSFLSKEQQEINAVRDKYFTLIEMAEQMDLDTLVLEEARYLAIQEIEDRYREEREEKERLSREQQEQNANNMVDLAIKGAETIDLRRKQSFEEGKKSAQELFNLAERFASTAHSNELKRAKEKVARGHALTKAEEKRLKNLDKVQKAFALAQIGIDTATAISGIIAASTAGDPYTYAARVAAGIATVIGNVAQAYQILGENPEIPTVSNSGGDLLEESIKTSEQPTLNNFSSGSTLLNQPQQVYVLESDITTTQNNVSVIEAQATFG